MQPMTALVDRAQAQTRFALILIGVFAGIAALLAAVGLYGVLASAPPRSACASRWEPLPSASSGWLWDRVWV
jgi:hypothetical protein